MAKFAGGNEEIGKQDDAFGERTKADDANIDSLGNIRKDDDEREAAEPLANWLRLNGAMGRDSVA